MQIISIEFTDFYHFIVHENSSPKIARIVSLPPQRDAIFLFKREVMQSFVFKVWIIAIDTTFAQSLLVLWLRPYNTKKHSKGVKSKKKIERKKNWLMLKLLWGNFLSLKRLSSAQSNGTFAVNKKRKDIYDTKGKFFIHVMRVYDEKGINSI